MALIKCGECNKEVSDKAAACPHCGAPVIMHAASKSEPVNGWVALKWVGLLLIVMLIGQTIFKSIVNEDPPASVASTNTTPTTTTPITKQPEKPSAEKLKSWMDALDSKTSAPALRKVVANNVIENFPGTPEAAKAAKALPELDAQIEEEKSYGRWSYFSNQDRMSSGKVKVATVDSDNAISLSSPYEGSQNGTLMIQNHPRQGRSILVKIQKGQIMCSSYDCSIRVRFDEGKATTYQGTEPSDNSTETVFLPDALLKRVQQAKRVRIEMNLYHNGLQVLDFNVKGFDPERLKN